MSATPHIANSSLTSRSIGRREDGVIWDYWYDYPSWNLQKINLCPKPTGDPSCDATTGRTNGPQASSGPAARIAAAKSNSEINVADARALHKKLSDVIAAHEQKNSSAARRATRLDAALADPARQPAINYANGALRRLGLDFVAASDMNKLTEAMREKNLDVATRIELKRVLSDLGVLD